MTDAQKRLRELRDRQSRERQRMAELSREATLTDETRGELDTIENGTPDLERQIRAASKAVEDEDREAEKKGKGNGETVDAETRARIELRGRASLGRYLKAASGSGRLDGAEAELAQAAGLADGQIPLELWDVPNPNAESRDDDETRAITPAPGTVGVNLDVLRPMVFAPSVVDKLMVEMPMVESGTYATGTITTAATADAVAKSAEVPESAGEFTVQTTTPHRIGASLNLTLEDIAAIGVGNFESILRQHLSLVLSDELDDQMLNGDNANNDLTGFFQRLTDPADPTAVATFDSFLAAFAGGIDGLWATQLSEVSIVAGVDSYRLSARSFRDIAAADLGAISFADYAKMHTAGWWTNKRMPDASNANFQQAILCRKGRSTMPAPMRLSVCPHWGFLSVDDIYSGARKGERRYVLSVLVGDLILVQPDAYAQVSFQTE